MDLLASKSKNKKTLERHVAAKSKKKELGGRLSVRPDFFEIIRSGAAEQSICRMNVDPALRVLLCDPISRLSSSSRVLRLAQSDHDTNGTTTSKVKILE